ncbi:Trihelix transcription factor ASIL2 [Quillaja saponaria]|uniref:Trihelix transcription factor ASIL2 n=1 Tax=Quillaja saponaria TaxID=32244 RepID=A0AAD7L6S1_QUISA|nr:Trihelix transcription factor ASIL2 [Quillaja saponaria]
MSPDTLSTVSSPPRRKFPAPCWTHDESVALIEAYRDKWFSLRRGILRSADWDDVAAAVGCRCPLASPPKTSVQCRHKMEKLRKRYRSEKQRCLTCPGRFFSSWVLFHLMDSLEKGSSSSLGSNQDQDFDRGNYDRKSGFCVKTSGDWSEVPPGFKAKRSKHSDGSSGPSLGLFDDYGSGSTIKGLGGRNGTTAGFRNKIYTKINDDSDTIIDSNWNLGSGSVAKSQSDQNSAPRGLRYKNYATYVDDNPSTPCGFPLKTLGDRISAPSAFRPKNYVSADWHGTKYQNDKQGVFHTKNLGVKNFGPPGFKPENYARVNGPDIYNRFFHGCPSSTRSGFRKKSSANRVEGEMDPFAEIVSSIKMFGEEFLKLEKMKMEMAQEIEKMRMEMEMKHNEMMLESQQLIVDAFAKALTETKKVKLVSP